MKGLFVSLLVILLTACSSLAGNQNSLSEKQTLYSVYADYASSANEENILDIYKNYFSPGLVAGDEADDSAIPFLLFKNEMKDEGEHFEKLEGPESGCLTVEGVGQDGKPLEFNIRYILVEGRWYMDGSHVRFLESVEQYSGMAVCP